MYDTRLGRWMSRDALENKYPFLTPYNFVANNPILFIDIDGRDFIVKNKHDQAQITSALSLLFNGSQDAFSFDKKGKLTIDASKIHGDLKPDQSYLLEKIQNIATDTDSKIKISNVKNGGNYTDPKSEDDNGKLTNAKIKINTSHPKVPSKLKDTKKSEIKEGDKKYKPSDDEVRAIILIHEIGHISEHNAGNRIGTLENDQRTVGFENVARRISGLKERIGNTHGDNDGNGTHENKGVKEPSK